MADVSKIQIGDLIYNLNDADMQARLVSEIARAKDAEQSVLDKVGALFSVDSNGDIVITF